MVRLIDEAVNDPVQVSVQRPCFGRWKNQRGRIIANRNRSLFIVFRLEAEFWFEANRNRLVFRIDVHPLGDRSLSDWKPVPDEKTGKSFFRQVRELKDCGDFLFRVGCVLFVLLRSMYSRAASTTFLHGVAAGRRPCFFAQRSECVGRSAVFHPNHRSASQGNVFADFDGRARLSPPLGRR